ncbi:MAG: 4-hydroxythreonine-4-phosphate dehydrogenase PdxA [Phycisphaerae bacterium]|jgi:4-hydroxythreonine-4-phosphate dehydrogenase
MAPTPEVRPLRLAISMGDPSGIGAEVIVKSLASPQVRGLADVTVHGMHGPMAAAAQAAGIEPFWSRVSPQRRGEVGPGVTLVDDELAGERPPHGPDSAEGGRLSFTWVLRAMDDVAGGASAMVTAPISKRAWSLAGHGEYPGHTELVASRWRSERYAMFFHAPASATGPGLNVILATVHIPLSQVPRHLTVNRVADTIELAHETMRRLGVDAPTVGVCGLNPHAGEGGLLGTEDADVIAPAIEACRGRGVLATGPHPADTIFTGALWHEGRRPRHDVVVAMYHDQGLPTLKTLAWDRAVNMTVGVPVVRTSPDHGTGFDIAGRNLANPGSMTAAIRLAVRMASSRT